jgi:hypothetical protein
MSLGTDGPSYGVVGNRVWRFVDLARRLDFLLADIGWCKMPPLSSDRTRKSPTTWFGARGTIKIGVLPFDGD